MSGIEIFMIVAWALVFIVTLIIEFSTSDLTTIWFCISAAITCVLAVFKINPLLQVAIFVALSVVFILSTRPLTKKMMKTEIIHTNADKLIGMIATVTTDIKDGEIGEVKVDNNLWRAVSLDGNNILCGQKVIVNSINGNKLIVSNTEKNFEIL